MKKIEKAIAYEPTFEEDVRKGLTVYPKYLLSKYIYDQKGDKLFQQIMDMPEYYLTRSEFEILRKNTQAISEIFNGKDGFDLIELGAGDGKKTKLLLRYLNQENINFSYLPIDISPSVLQELVTSLKEELPTVEVKAQRGTYFKTLQKLSNYNSRKKVIIVLGSNIGNLHHKDAIDFLKNIRYAMEQEDILFMGFDQKKSPQKILDAYSDSEGITEAFNKNLLIRINSELDANFKTDSFLHWETYDPESGTAKSFLVSKLNQKVKIKALNLEVQFHAWETIHTEISQKYDDKVVNWLAREAGLQVETSFTDKEKYYKNYIFKIDY
ncbi:L-histidine N(alpha)-methyltransferase [Zunongwangia sp. H14]|uniref:L-histidine N(alpha)-methyltransferase n=1 Tax=Zunongwangia sp. H14 TaxID=3240792 RepID=UPI003562A1E5